MIRLTRRKPDLAAAEQQADERDFDANVAAFDRLGRTR